MNIANLLGTSTSSALEAVYGQKKKDEKEDGAQSGVHSWRQDTVSFSEAALALLEVAGKEQAPSDGNSARDAMNGQTAQGDPLAAAQGDEVEGTEGDGGGQPFSLGGNSNASDIEVKIKQLQQKIVETQNGSLPEDTKSAVISGLQSQISALVQEKNALEQSQTKKG